MSFAEWDIPRDFLQRKEAVDTLFEAVKGRFVKGQDIFAVEDSVLFPGGNDTFVGIPKDAYPPFSTLPLHQILKYYSLSMRSRYAQVGVYPDQIYPDHFYQIPDDLKKDFPDITHLANVPIINTGNQHVFVPKGEQLFRLFSYDSQSTAVGAELRRLLDKDCPEEYRVEIEGEQGEDWEFEYWPNLPQNDPRNPSGVRIKISGKPLWIPPQNDGALTKLLRIDQMGKNFRPELTALMEEAPLTDTFLFWISETPRVKLGQMTEGILQDFLFRTTDPDENVGLTTDHMHHIKSPLIDRGWDGPMRVEINSPTLPELRPQFVTLRLFAHHPLRV